MISNSLENVEYVLIRIIPAIIVASTFFCILDEFAGGKTHIKKPRNLLPFIWFPQALEGTGISCMGYHRMQSVAPFA